MQNLTFSLDEARLMISAIDALRRMGPSKDLDRMFVQMQQRIRMNVLGFNEGELRNLCMGLEWLLKENPLDWKAEKLLVRLRSTLPDPEPRLNP